MMLHKAALCVQRLLTWCFAFRSHRFHRWDDPNVVPYGNPPDYSGLFITDGVSIFPHYSEQWAALVTEKRKTIDHPVVTLTDYQAYLIDGDDRRVV
eukprot:1186236-Prorocentrum_minimum.AAC.1